MLGSKRMMVDCAESSLPRADGEVRLLVRECPLLNVASEPRTLHRNEVHIWHGTFSPTHLEELTPLNLLSEDETARMSRFRFEKDQKNFLLCRSMLRILLASYLGDPPAELRFAYSAHGKPTLAISSGSLEFNLSHSNGNFLVAITLARKVGVDIEFLKRDLDVLDIARRFFSSAEKRAIEDLPDELRQDAFFSCWTRKEAFIKARGEGLSCPLDSFDVSVMPDEESVNLATRPDSSEADRWTLRSLKCFPGYRAAVAVESKNVEPRPF